MHLYRLGPVRLVTFPRTWPAHCILVDMYWERVSPISRMTAALLLRVFHTLHESTGPVPCEPLAGK